MPNEEQTTILLRTFREAVLDDAQSERDRLAAEMETRRVAELEKAKKEINTRIDHYIRSETEKARNEWNQRVASHVMACRNELQHIREGIEAEVFAGVEAKLREFIVSTVYDGYFSALLKRHGSAFAGRSFIFEVGTADLEREGEILALCPGSTVQENPDIRLGGFVATESNGAFRIMETGESRLERIRERFSEYVDLVGH